MNMKKLKLTLSLSLFLIIIAGSLIAYMDTYKSKTDFSLLREDATEDQRIRAIADYYELDMSKAESYKEAQRRLNEGAVPNPKFKGVKRIENFKPTDVCEWNPKTPWNGDVVDIYYNPSKGKLGNAKDIYVHITFGEGISGNREIKLFYDKSTGYYKTSFKLPDNARQLNLSFYTLKDNISLDGGLSSTRTGGYSFDELGVLRDVYMGNGIAPSNTDVISAIDDNNGKGWNVEILVLGLSVWQSAQLGLDWLARESINWSKTTGYWYYDWKCNGCHVQAQAIQCMSIGVQHGYNVRFGALDSLVDYMTYMDFAADPNCLKETGTNSCTRDGKGWFAQAEAGAPKSTWAGIGSTTQCGITYLGPLKDNGDRIDWDADQLSAATGRPISFAFVNRSTVTSYRSVYIDTILGSTDSWYKLGEVILLPTGSSWCDEASAGIMSKVPLDKVDKIRIIKEASNTDNADVYIDYVYVSTESGCGQGCGQIVPSSPYASGACADRVGNLGAYGERKWSKNNRVSTSQFAIAALVLYDKLGLLGLEPTTRWASLPISKKPYSTTGNLKLVADWIKNKQDLTTDPCKYGSLPQERDDPPIEQGRILATANALKGWCYLRDYRGYTGVYDTQIARAVQYLRYMATNPYPPACAPVNPWDSLYTQDRTMIIQGLLAAGFPRTDPDILKAREWIIKHRQSDRGWRADNYPGHIFNGHISDGFATGQVLYTFHILGMSHRDSMFVQTTRWLVENQFTDGSWEQPYGAMTRYASTMWAVNGLVGAFDKISVAITNPMAAAVIYGVQPVTADAVENFGGEITSMEYYINDALKYTYTVPTSGVRSLTQTWNWNTSSYPDGVYEIKVIAKGRKFISGAWQYYQGADSINVIIDNIIISGTVYDDVTNIVLPNVKVKFTDIATGVVDSTYTNASGYYSKVWGKNAIRIEVADNNYCGNPVIGTYTTDVTVDLHVRSLILSNIITSPANGSAVTGIVNVQGTATATCGGNITQIQLIIGGQTFVMDGNIDPTAQAILTNAGLTLYLGWNGTELYVATNSAQSQGGDMFIFLADGLYPLVAAPWAKSGQVAGWSAMLTNESTNNWCGWQDVSGTVTSAAGANYLEGTINLRSEFGTIPSTLYIAVAKYGTNNGNGLLAQVPKMNALGNPANIEGNELYQYTHTLTPAGLLYTTISTSGTTVNYSIPWNTLAECLNGSYKLTTVAVNEKNIAGRGVVSTTSAYTVTVNASNINVSGTVIDEATNSFLTGTAPKEVGYYDDPSSSAYSRNLVVQGNYVYLADGDAGVKIVDVTNPVNPVLVGSYNPTGFDYVGGLFINGNLLYCGAGNSGLVILNVSNPASPTLVGSYNTTGYSYGVWVAGNYAYVADGVSGLQIINVSNPASPTLAGTYDTPGTAKAVTYRNGYAYIADGDQGVRIVDVYNPAGPFEVGFYDTYDAQRLSLYGQYVYLADGALGGFRIINITNPASPTQVSQYKPCSSFGDCAGYGVYAVGNYVYLADGKAGIRIINVSNPTTPVEVRQFIISDTTGRANGVYTVGSYTYAACGKAGLRVIEGFLANVGSGVEVRFSNVPTTYSNSGYTNEGGIYSLCWSKVATQIEVVSPYYCGGPWFEIYNASTPPYIIKNLTVRSLTLSTSFGYPTNGATVSGFVNINANASALCSGNVTKVELFIDNVRVDTLNTTGLSVDYSYTWNTLAYPNCGKGWHSLKFKATNEKYIPNRGNLKITKYDSINVFVDNIVLSGYVKDVSNTSSIVGMPNVKVKFYHFNTGLSDSTFTDSNGRYSICWIKGISSIEIDVSGYCGEVVFSENFTTDSGHDFEVYLPKLIYGYVINKANGERVPFAEVYLTDSSYFTRTTTADDSGYYSFEICEFGDYCVDASAPYYPASEETCKTNITTDTRMDVYLVPITLKFTPNPRTLSVMVDSASCAGSVDIWLEGAEYVKGAYIFFSYDTTKVRLLDAGLPNESVSLWPPNSISSSYYTLNPAGYGNRNKVGVYIVTRKDFIGTTKLAGALYTMLFKYKKSYVDTSSIEFIRSDSSFGIWDAGGSVTNKNVVFTELNGVFVAIDTLMGDVSKSTYSPTCVAEPNLIGDKRLAWCDAELFRYNYAEQRLSPTPGSTGWKIANVAGPAVPFDSTKVDQDGTPPWAPYNGKKDGIHYPFKDASVDTLDWEIFFEQYNYCNIGSPLRRNEGIVTLPASASMEVRNAGYEMRDNQVSSIKYQEFTVDIPVNNIANMMVGHITITYDSKLLQAVRYDASEYFGNSGVPLIQANFIDNNKGTVKIDFATLGDLANGSGILGSIVFKANENGETKMDLTGVIKDYRNAPILTPTATTTISINGIRTPFELPIRYELAQNHPNPFNPITTIRYAIAGDGGQGTKNESPVTRHPSLVTLRIYNISGQLIKTLVNEKQEPGYYTVRWDGKDDKGKDVTSGVYVYRLDVVGDKANFSAVKRMVLLK